MYTQKSGITFHFLCVKIQPVLASSVYISAFGWDMKHLWRQVFCFCFLTRWANQHRIKANRCCKIEENLKSFCVGDKVHSGLEHARVDVSLSDFFSLVQQFVSGENFNDIVFFFYDTELYSFCPRRSIPLNCGPPFSRHLALPSPRIKDVMEVVELYSQNFIYTELFHDFQRNLFHCALSI